VNGPTEFGTAYASALTAYLRDGDERARTTAYELGREAATIGLGVMDVAEAHHAAVAAALGDGASATEVATAAGDIFLETLSAFEMLARGLAEARDVAERERRHAAILRQLSNFLADASLAASAEGSTHEILHLVAEQARELIGGACCVANVGADHDAVAARAASFAPDEAPLGARLALADLSRLEELMRSSGAVARLDPREWLDPAAVGSHDGAKAVRSWVAVALARLDGRSIGFIHAFDRRPRAFTSADGEVLLQLAQMGSAALERAELYARQAADG
jgi:hypothetical protein